MKCSCGSDPSVAWITVGGASVGIAGLEEIFQTWRAAGREPQGLTRAEIIKVLEKHNYVIPRLRDEYAEAIRARYEAAIEAESQGKTGNG